MEKALGAMRAALPDLGRASDATRSAALRNLAEAARKGTDKLLVANRKDLDRMDPTDPKYDRLLLSEERIEAIAADLERVADLPTPLGEVLEESTLDNGLKLTKVRVPLGVIAVIFESRPNVTFDVFGLCLKTGNACVLKGSRDADKSNKVIAGMIQDALASEGLPTELAYLAPSARNALDEVLGASGLIDLVIPRGGRGLIDHVREHARVPIIETGAGIVHTYLDISADPAKARAIVDNAKTRRTSVCNALDCLVVHEEFLSRLADVLAPLAEKDVEILADAQSFRVLVGAYAGTVHRAEDDDFGREFLSMKMAIRTVPDVTEAIAHIQHYSSAHSEAIVAEDGDAIERFLDDVDAAVVYVNASTAFTDGGEFGMGAEIGISTQKMHARGPMGLKEMTSYKWIAHGDGHVRD